MMNIKPVDYAMISRIWAWFRTANYWSKAQFLMITMRLCRPDLLYGVSRQVSVLLGAELDRLESTADLTIRLESTADLAVTDEHVRSSEANYFTSGNDSDLEFLYSVWNTVHPDWAEENSLSLMNNSENNRKITVSDELPDKDTVKEPLDPDQLFSSRPNILESQKNKSPVGNTQISITLSQSKNLNENHLKSHTDNVSISTLHVVVNNDDQLFKTDAITVPLSHQNRTNLIEDLIPIDDLRVSSTSCDPSVEHRSSTHSPSSRMSSASLRISSASSGVDISRRNSAEDLTPFIVGELENCLVDRSTVMQQSHIEVRPGSDNNTSKMSGRPTSPTVQQNRVNGNEYTIQPVGSVPRTNSLVDNSELKLSNVNSRSISRIINSRISSAPPSVKESSNMLRAHRHQKEASTRISKTLAKTPVAGFRAYSRDRDFIRCLPVHLSKYVLSLLDQPSRAACWLVCKQWRILVDEVLQEKLIIKQLLVEFKLMQVRT